MKKVMVLVLVLALALGSGMTALAEGEATEIEFWTFQTLHVAFYEEMAKEWNELNPDRQIVLKPDVYDFEQMHELLGNALLAGEGAPDLVDIEFGKYANFLRGDIQLVPLNDIVEPELDNIVKARVDIYAKDGKYYGICFHVGAAIIFYNQELCASAGIDYSSIKTWDEYYEAAKTFKAANPDKYWMSVESSDIWHMWPQLAELGADMTDADGNATINTPEMAKVLEYNRRMVKEGLAVVAPGTYHHAEEFYALMDGGNIASIVMPFWYLDRFTNYMPDLAGKMKVSAMPLWADGGHKSAQMGGTGTAVVASSPNAELAKEFLAYACLTFDGCVTTWKICGFDPILKDVYGTPEMQEPNEFFDYYGDDIFTNMMTVLDDIPDTAITDMYPAATDIVKAQMAYDLVYTDKTGEEIAKECADQLRSLID